MDAIYEDNIINNNDDNNNININPNYEDGY